VHEYQHDEVFNRDEHMHELVLDGDSNLHLERDYKHDQLDQHEELVLLDSQNTHDDLAHTA